MKPLTHILLLLPFLTIAQVGIGTTAPTSTLHVAGDVRFEVIPEQLTDSILTTDGQGNVGYRNINSFPVQTTNYQRVRIYANAPRIITVPELYIDDVHLNLAINPITIPPGFSGILNIKTSVPLGLRSNPAVVEAYAGITLWRNGVLLPNESRKFSLDKDQTGNDIAYRMGYVQIDYFEFINNPSSTNITLDFEVFGWIEHYSPTDATTTYVFNMWDADVNQNFNWGKGYLEYELKGF